MSYHSRCHMPIGTVTFIQHSHTEGKATGAFLGLSAVRGHGVDKPGIALLTLWSEDAPALPPLITTLPRLQSWPFDESKPECVTISTKYDWACCSSCLALLDGPSTLCPRGVPWKAVACSRSRQTSCRLPSTSSNSRSTTPLCCSISASFSEQLCTTSDSSSTAKKAE